jgi:succinate-acetate transporter protein
MFSIERMTVTDITILYKNNTKCCEAEMIVSNNIMNTKYAEPMGMGYIGSIIPAVILCFYHFGYISDFRLAMPAILCGFLCHILASYYSFPDKS